MKPEVQLADGVTLAFVQEADSFHTWVFKICVECETEIDDQNGRD